MLILFLCPRFYVEDVNFPLYILEIKLYFLASLSLLLFVFLSMFKFIHLSSIVKQVLTTYLNHSRVRFLEPASTGVITIRNHGRDPCEVRTHDPEVARQTHSLGPRSSLSVNPNYTRIYLLLVKCPSLWSYVTESFCLKTKV